MMGALGKGDKSVIQRKLLFKFYNNGFISTSNSEQEKQTNREKYVFYCSVSQIHINPEKNTKNPIIMTVWMYLLIKPSRLNIIKQTKNA